MYKVGDVLELTATKQGEWSYFLYLRQGIVNQHVFVVDWFCINSQEAVGNSCMGTTMTTRDLRFNEYKKSVMTPQQFNMLHNIYSRD